MRRSTPRPLLNTRTTRNRAGLAPLEFVLSLPVLLFTMGLMMVFAAGATWKIRSQMVSRYAAWGSLEGRGGIDGLSPTNWPAGNQAGLLPTRLESGTHSLDFLEHDQLQQFRIVRGPDVVAASGGGQPLPVNENLFDPLSGERNGFGRVHRRPPVLGPMLPSGIMFSRDHALQDSPWSYRGMGFGSNVGRRIPLLFDFQLDAQVPDLTQAYTNAAFAMIRIGPEEALALSPLEGNDPEIFELLNRASPDFRPQIGVAADRSTINALNNRSLRPSSQNCSLDTSWVQMSKVEPLKQQIRNVPRRMKQYYINAYQSKIRQLQAQDPIPPGDQALIAKLEGKIQQLQQFSP